MGSGGPVWGAGRGLPRLGATRTTSGVVRSAYLGSLLASILTLITFQQRFGVPRGLVEPMSWRSEAVVPPPMRGSSGEPGRHWRKRWVVGPRHKEEHRDAKTVGKDIKRFQEIQQRVSCSKGCCM